MGAVVALVVGLAGVGVAAPVIAVVKSSEALPFERATDAIVGALRRSMLRPDVRTFDLDGDDDDAAAVFSAVRRAEPAVVVTIGSIATAAALRFPGTTPVVFSMVLYPAQSGFLGPAQTRVTGASLDIPPDVQFAYLRRLLPAARRVGVLFNPDETGAIIEAARLAAARQGLTLMPRAIDAGDDVVAALRALMEEVDVVWTVADRRVFTPQATSALILAALRRRIPLFGLSLAHVRAGALAALYCDYDDVGQETAALALAVLGGKTPAELPLATPRHYGLALNLRTAEHLGLTVPADLAAEAGEIIR